LDYANNRYYSNAYGRFMTPDPYKGNSGGPGDPRDPLSWNRYAYTRGDPVNRYDPAGLDDCSPGDTLPCSTTVNGSSNPPEGWDMYPDGYGWGAYNNQYDSGKIQQFLNLSRKYVLQTALDQAMQALNSPFCNKLFNNPLGPSPQQVLQDLYNGNTDYGSILFGEIPENGPSAYVINATTTAWVPPPGSSVETGAIITLQTQGTYWNFPSGYDQAVTLIHELGHAFNIIFGEGSSSILDDAGNPTQSIANTNMIMKDCF
jgi:RHS repeat-associated protein